MYVCICARVRESEIRAAIAAGAGNCAAVARACGAGAGCGSCVGRIEAFLAEDKPANTDGWLPIPRMPLPVVELDALMT